MTSNTVLARLAGLLYLTVAVTGGYAELGIRTDLIVTGDALVMLFVDLHRHGYLIAEIFFGLWLLPLGYLLYISDWFPKTLGVLSMIGCLGYLLDVGATFTSPTLESGIGPIGLVPTAVAEVSVVLWLLIRGAKTAPSLRPETSTL
jgi:hypothetical protein